MASMDSSIHRGPPDTYQKKHNLQTVSPSACREVWQSRLITQGRIPSDMRILRDSLRKVETGDAGIRQMTGKAVNQCLVNVLVAEANQEAVDGACPGTPNLLFAFFAS
jgi:hypothetical protein